MYVESVVAVSGVPHIFRVVIANDESIVVSAPHRQSALRFERLGDCEQRRRSFVAVN